MSSTLALTAPTAKSVLGESVLRRFFAEDAPPVPQFWGAIRKLHPDAWAETVDEGLTFHFQPIFDLTTRQVFAYEALFRGRRFPQSWVKTDTQLVRLLGQVSAGVTLFVNLSVESILAIDDELVRLAVVRNDLYFEWTEEHCNPVVFRECAAKLNRWIRLGARIVIDDYGSGQDGLGRLLAIHKIDIVKFDGTLIKALTQDYQALAFPVLAANVQMLKKLGIRVIGECIESPELLAITKAVGIDMAQGFYLDGQVLHAVKPHAGMAGIA